MPNIFAYFMLIIWPVFSLTLFRRLKPLPATLWTIVGGYMILPEETFFDFPLIPSLDKESVASLIALAGCYFIAKEKVPLVPRKGLEKLLIIVLLCTPLITTITNLETFRHYPGMRFYDAFSWIIAAYINIIPFLIGLHLTRTYDDQLVIFKWLVVAGLIYSIPALFEVRMSPQLHRTFYGFFPHEWGQQIRFGGFRPVIFMQHGLDVAVFFATATMAAIALWKEKQGFFGDSKQTRKFNIVAVIYLITVLILCKSVGSIIYCLGFMLAVVFVPLPFTRLAAFLIISIVITYPLSSLLGIFPHEELLGIARSLDELRAQSLETRFINEDVLLTHAKEKLYFGWGLWGRNRPFAGVITDGFWIILIGTMGLAGFLALFGLPTLAVFRALKAGKVIAPAEGKSFIVFFALTIALIMVDQIVNASQSSWIWLLIGALLGRTNSVLRTNTATGKIANDLSSNLESERPNRA